MKADNTLLIAVTIILAALAIIGALLYVYLFNEGNVVPPVPPPSQDVGEDRVEGLAIDQQVEKVLFFQSPSNLSQLAPVRRRIFNTISLTQQANQVVQALIAGPLSGENAVATIPAGTRLLRCFVSPEGIATLVFNAEISTNHPGGTDAELITLYSIVNTLCVNFPNIRAVQFIISDREEMTLAGHIDISYPLSLEASMLPPVTMPGMPQPVAEPQDDGEQQPPAGDEQQSGEPADGDPVEVRHVA